MLEYTYTISNAEEKVLKHDLLDIKEWLDKAIAGKVNQCLKRMGKEYDRLATIDNLETVPTGLIDKVTALLQHPDYLDRAARDAAEMAAILAQANK